MVDPIFFYMYIPFLHVDLNIPCPVLGTVTDHLGGFVVRHLP